ncbi:three-helix bundle dimerization domain-containing protein [Nocardia fluminea]
MIKSTIHDRPAVLALPNPASVIADSMPHLPARELEAMAGVLASKFPEVPSAYVREVVESTYRKLASTARVQSHLIPLTLNLSRTQLVKALSNPT